MLRTGAGCAPRIWLVLKRHVAPRSGTPARASPAPLIRGDEPPGACVGGRRGVAVLFARRKGLGYEAAIALTSGIAMSEDCHSCSHTGCLPPGSFWFRMLPHCASGT